MGSDSDWHVMEAAAQVLEEFGIAYEADVISAHRMPEDMVAYGRKAHERGIRVIIAGAGGAAHLPGMLASLTPLPVIGVPVKLKSLDGMDSLLSIVQMPAGVPVATVSIDGARNAGLLALRILGAGADDFAQQVRSDLIDFAASLRQTAMDKGAALRSKVGERREDLEEDNSHITTIADAAHSARQPHTDIPSDDDYREPYAP
ncbi:MULTISPECIES: 5-(carboxyamino)imidazole ribonucleotide mutase [unclassified Rothia (in: high G+C Gram-positive bacteria)]|uniref:5-(carboxyamino)imidazole ribonucleotide mutase n=1 Tax=unclassified Rothia (in: high G+C Gram-positive bacteria) TaxID=2689056 RepID=UPI0019569F87|nr:MULTISPECIES: 5-(carboxyamino)imidazole ribonucleotide mutase [unclassified Rothia (in: high G+C Gram-positive bacteria)]MBM7051432.1 5-(carboxyamino)imidazole ribonucleotide mutase [Rothia sp. ZJ1223]QRZ62638.1 5-(carboxyamino)imidazole ribonucleotide mutase [Rothia sp. ZJ932]